MGSFLEHGNHHERRRYTRRDIWARTKMLTTDSPEFGNRQVVKFYNTFFLQTGVQRRPLFLDQPTGC
jgi:hypothetical protein